jgi:ABC-type glycerol-3-phosphate transport system substrate-binding protein
LALLALGLLAAGSAMLAPASSMASHPGVVQDSTLSVYTCCGSLTGFGSGSSDPASMHSTYATLWARQFPHLQWKETTFASQPAMEQKLAAVVASGTPPDMVFVQGGTIGELVLRGLVQPLDRLYASAGVTST